MHRHEQPDHRPHRTGVDGSDSDESARGGETVTSAVDIPTSGDDHDATRFRVNACELRAESARLERLLRTFSHDLRGQLMVASGHLELARAETDPADHLDAIERAHDRIEVLVADVSALAADGSVVGEREPVGLERLVEDCWASVETAGATLVVDADGAVQADASRLAQVFENLFRNAVKHGSPSGRTGTDDAATASLTVTVGLLPERSGFFVEDDGTGIPDGQRDRAFEAGVSTSEDGTGLGLAIVRDVVAAHGWTVELTESDDGGARFEITGVELGSPDT